MDHECIVSLLCASDFSFVNKKSNVCSVLQGYEDQADINAFESTMKNVKTLEKLKEMYITWLLSGIKSSLIDNLQTSQWGGREDQ